MIPANLIVISQALLVHTLHSMYRRSWANQRKGQRSKQSLSNTSSIHLLNALLAMVGSLMSVAGCEIEAEDGFASAAARKLMDDIHD